MNDQELPALDAESLSLLAQARDMLEPSAESRARVRWKLELGLVSGAAVAGYSASALATAAKLVGAVVALAAVGSGAWYLESRAPIAAVPRSSAPLGLANASAAPRSAPLKLEPPRPPAPPAPHRTLPRAEANTSPAAPSLSGEIELLQRANAALNRGDGSTALSLLTEYDRRYKSGRLLAERSAARVLALCRVGNVGAAESAARQFLARWPRSPLAARIGASCAPNLRARGEAP